MHDATAPRIPCERVLGQPMQFAFEYQGRCSQRMSAASSHPRVHQVVNMRKPVGADAVLTQAADFT